MARRYVRYEREDDADVSRQPAPASTFEADGARRCGAEEDLRDTMPWRCTRRRGHAGDEHHAHDDRGAVLFKWVEKRGSR